MHDSLILSRRLRVEGDSTLGLERGARSGVFVRVRPGAYLPTREWEAMDDRTRHRVSMDAFAMTSARRVVFAVESAAALHGIPIVGGWPAHPRVVSEADYSRRTRVGVEARWRPVSDMEVVSIGGMRATSLARTALDIAAERDLVAGVVALDHVIHSGAVHLVDLHAYVDSARPFPGVRKVIAALALATGTAETPLESLSVVRFAQLGFDPPTQQREFVVDGQRYRADFSWEEAGVIGEADGREKYLAGPDVLWKEKQREDALRSVTRGFARWGWDQAWAGAPMAVRLERAGLRRNPRIASRYAFRPPAIRGT
ncbi:MAG: hypothetical protein ABIR17_00055 [Pseudolysinimonas sp.]|uniref:hypothetical protein n=1 Tax=Pseudolysinimonas sp. TaxID=2680009 RepID=UPI0032634604